MAGSVPVSPPIGHNVDLPIDIRPGDLVGAAIIAFAEIVRRNSKAANHGRHNSFSIPDWSAVAIWSASCLRRSVHPEW